MNLGITTSFLVGGLLLLSILQMNFTVTNNSMQTTMQMIAKNRMMAITETLENDFARMGYNVTGGDVITDHSKHKITFSADVNNDGNVEEITWEFKEGDPYTSTPNPNDYKLVRTGPVSETSGSVETTFSAVDFQLSLLNNGKQIKVTLLCESPEAVSNGGDKTYGRSYWQSTIVPPGLQFQNN